MLRIWIHLIRKILASWIRIRITGSAKICGSTDPDSRGKISPKNLQKKTFLLLKPKAELLKKKDYIFLIFEWFIKFWDKKKGKKIKEKI